MTISFNKKNIGTVSKETVNKPVATEVNNFIQNNSSTTIELSGNDNIGQPFKYYLSLNAIPKFGKAFQSNGVEINFSSGENQVELLSNKIIYKPNKIGREILKFFIKTTTDSRVSSLANITIDIQEFSTFSVNLSQVINEYNIVDNPKIILTTDFKELKKNESEYSEQGNYFFSKYDRQRDIANKLHSLIVFNNLSKEDQEKVSRFRTEQGKILKEVNYLKDINNAVFDLYDTSLLGTTRFFTNTNSPIAKRFFGQAANGNAFSEILNSIQPFSTVEFFEDFKYINVVPEIENRFFDSNSITFLFLLENIKKLFTLHHRVGPNKTSLEIKDKDYFNLKQFKNDLPEDHLQFANVKNGKIFILNDVVLGHLFYTASKVNQLTENVIEASCIQLETVFSDIFISKILDNEESKNNIEPFLNNQINSTNIKSIADEIFGIFRPPTEINKININNLGKTRSLQQIGLITRTTIDANFNSSNITNILNSTETDNIFCLDSNYGFKNIKTNFISPSLELTKNSTSQEALYSFKNDILEARRNKLTSMINGLEKMLTSISNTSLLQGQNPYINPLALNESNLNHLNIFYSLFNLIKNNQNLNDFSLPLFRLSKDRAVKRQLFLYCLCEMLRREIPNSENIQFINQKKVETANILRDILNQPRPTDQTSPLGLISSSTPINTLYENLVSNDQTKMPIFLNWVVEVMSQVFKTTHKSSQSTYQYGQELKFVFSEVNSIVHFVCIFNSLSDIISYIFGIRWFGKNGTKIEIQINRHEKRIENCNSVLSVFEKPVKIKYKSFKFIDGILSKNSTKLSTLINLLDTKSQKFKTEFQPGLDYLFQNFPGDKIDGEFLSLIIDDNNIDKSVKNIEIIKESTVVFDHFYTALKSQKTREIVERFLFDIQKNAETFYNRKIISIGLPCGFLEKFSNIETQNFIKINLYKTDLRYPEVILKPKTFLFEPSRYLKYQSFDLTNASSIEKIIDTIPQITFIKGTQPINISTTNNLIQTFVNNKLTIDDRRKLIYNHVMDYVLGIYLRIFNNSTKYFIDDNLCLLNQGNEDLYNIPSHPINNKITILRKQIRPLLTTKEAEQLRYNFFNSFSQFSYGKMFRDYVYLPKRFDRIFTLLIDPDDFLIDFDKTKELNFQDQDSEMNRYFENISIRNVSFNEKKLPFISVNNGDTVFDQYIFDVEII